MIEQIKIWIESYQKITLKDYETAFSTTFGFVRMADGREAQVKVTLEMDEEEWE